jgi:hypothetical protein
MHLAYLAAHRPWRLVTRTPSRATRTAPLVFHQEVRHPLHLSGAVPATARSGRLAPEPAV